MTEQEKSAVYECGDCGWRVIEDDVPRANDPWTTDGGSLMYCDGCGVVDNMVPLLTWEDVKKAVLEETERCAQVASDSGHVGLAEVIRGYWEDQ